MSAGVRALCGLLAWAVLSLPAVTHLLHGSWAHAMLTFAALVVMPLLLELVPPDRAGPFLSTLLLRLAVALQLPAAALLAIAFRMEPGAWSTLAAAPWAAVLLMLAASGLARTIQRSWGDLPALCGDAGLAFAAIGAAWLLADRAAIRPLGFSGEVVLLTAIHFHYAGIVLPILAATALHQLRRRALGALIAAGVIAGVPAVAIGITLTQLQVLPAVEAVAALLMAASGAAVGVVHVGLGLQRHGSMGVRCGWVLAGASLAVGMTLAALYGVRGFFAPWPWLDIPWMRALHGTVNAIGFGLFGTLAWWCFARRAKMSGPREA
jgi:hypothetical protein